MLNPAIFAQISDMDICVPEEGITGKHATVVVVIQADTYRFIIKSCDEETPLDFNGSSISQAKCMMVIG